MSLANFIPQIWSAQLLVRLRASLIYGQDGTVNRNYEGEISSYGDTVKINGIGPVTVGDYTRNENIGDPENITDNTRTLQITQSKFFNFQVDDLDKAQQNPKVMGESMVEAAYALRNAADSFISNDMYTNVDPANVIGSDASPITPTSTDAYEHLVDLSVLLTEANIPEENRWAIVPAWFHALLLKDNRFIANPQLTGGQAIYNGQVGEAAGFRLLKSNTVPNTAGQKYKIIAGHPMAYSFAEQINDVEAYRPQQRFADAVKGLHLYGGKLIRPTGLAVLTANRS